MNIEPKPTDKPAHGPNIRRIDLRTILGDDREVIISHRSEEYRLRLTSNNKLLLTK